MAIKTLQLQRVRNIQQASLEPSDTLNLIIGDNGAGKSALLEAIHVLGLGRSFRTTHINEVIQKGQDSLLATAKLQHGERSVQIGIEKGKEQTQVRIGGQAVNQLAQLAEYLPIQVIHPLSHELLTDGPKQRRQFLDWGVFHVEHTYLQTWQQYQKSLRQRNAALRQQLTEKNVRLWDASLIRLAVTMTVQREAYLSRLHPAVERFTHLLLDMEIEMSYQQGWNQEESLIQAIERQFTRDREQGHTRSGPHRADIRILVDRREAEQYLSRGQQKLLVCAMRLAQAQVFAEDTGRRCVILVDDLPAELDPAHRQQLTQVLIETKAQLFVTMTEASLLKTEAWPGRKMFHVEHGEIRELL